MLVITEQAVKELKIAIAEQEDQENVRLRVRIVGGGCSGFMPKLELVADYSDKHDTLYEVNGIKVVIDKRSTLYLEGAVVDFYQDLNKRGFVVDIPGSKGKCGCGSSFSM